MSYLPIPQLIIMRFTNIGNVITDSFNSGNKDTHTIGIDFLFATCHRMKAGSEGPKGVWKLLLNTCVLAMLGILTPFHSNLAGKKVKSLLWNLLLPSIIQNSPRSEHSGPKEAGKGTKESFTEYMTHPILTRRDMKLLFIYYVIY